MTAYRLPNHFPDHLAATYRPDASWLSCRGQGNGGSTLRRRYATLALLLVLCLLPRLFMAWKIGGICPDAFFYIKAAQSFDKGSLLAGTYRFGLNLYPLALMLLHRSGLDWELAGKIWNVTISCLTVLPLYGWVRRQFDDRVALAAGCLYAMHSELIRSSPEGIRDPTFWFFMVLALYLLWRAVTEVRLLFFLVGGLAMALAAMTRSEGLFLVVPLLLWSYRRGRQSGRHTSCAVRPAALAANVGWDQRAQASAGPPFAFNGPALADSLRGYPGSLVPPCRRLAPQPRIARRLLLGVMLAGAVFPMLLVLASLVWFRNHAPWEMVRTKPFDFVSLWIHAGLAKVAGSGAPVSAASCARCTQMLGLFAVTLFKGLTPVFTLFACSGVAGWWSTWKRRDHQVTFYTVLLLLLAIGIHMGVAGETSKRYFLPVALLMSPFAALGLLAGSAQLLRWAEGRHWGLKAKRLAAWMPLLFFLAFSLGNVVVCDYRQRSGQAELGRWAHNEFGRTPVLLGPNGVTQVVTYYAQGWYEGFAQNENERNIEDLMRRVPFDIILLTDDHEPLPGQSALLQCAAGLGYRPLDDKPFSSTLRNMVVLTRRNPGAKD